MRMEHRPTVPHTHSRAGKGAFVPLKDTQDGYSLLYPFGWQEVTVRGQDQVYKDVIEPLESVSVAVVPTDKETVSEFGSPAEVAVTLADRVLSAPGQEVRLIKAEQVGAGDARDWVRSCTGMAGLGESAWWWPVY